MVVKYLVLLLQTASSSIFESIDWSTEHDYPLIDDEIVEDTYLYIGHDSNIFLGLSGTNNGQESSGNSFTFERDAITEPLK